MTDEDAAFARGVNWAQEKARLEGHYFVEDSPKIRERIEAAERAAFERGVVSTLEQRAKELRDVERAAYQRGLEDAAKLAENWNSHMSELTDAILACVNRGE